MSDHDKPHICFVAPTIWPIFACHLPHSGVQIKSVGGAEVQQSLLARTFVRAGYPVSIITMNYGQEADIELDGIKIYQIYRPEEGLPVIRFVYPRLTSIWSALKRVGADVYYQRACGMLTGVVGQFCRTYERRFIYAAASDADFENDLPMIEYRRDKWLYRHGLQHVDRVVVQNEKQQQTCKRNFGIDTVIIKSGYEVPENAVSNLQGYVLWAATLKDLKRPELFIELARRLPNIRFRMVGGGEGSALYERVRTLVSQLPNLEFTGFVPYPQMDDQFDGARIFVNTSTWEGFPNTFLQAWARGIPAVSFIDTGSKVEGKSVVISVSDLEQMVTQVNRLMTEDAAWYEVSERSKRCYNLEHRPEAILNSYEEIIKLL